MRLNAIEEKYEIVTVLDKPMLFTCLRIDRKTVPKGLYMYEVRHDDECQGIPCQIANWIMVNHLGTLITNEPIDLNDKASNNAYLNITEDDFNYEGIECTIEEYIEQYSSEK